jgi:hypothetical protein
VRLEENEIGHQQVSSARLGQAYLRFVCSLILLLVASGYATEKLSGSRPQLSLKIQYRRRRQQCALFPYGRRIRLFIVSQQPGGFNVCG